MSRENQTSLHNDKISLTCVIIIKNEELKRMLRRISGIVGLFFVGMLVMTGSLSAATVQKILKPIDDTIIAENHPSEFFGGITCMRLRSMFGGGWGVYPLIKFDLSSIPAGSQIIKARLHLYYYFWCDDNPAGHLYKIYQVLKNWNEETVCWNNRPTVYGISTAYQYCPAHEGTWISWTVTSDIQRFVSGVYQNYGWIIKDANSQSNAFVEVYSKEAIGQRTPVLEILYNPPV
jgi:hypothetical protein